MLLDEFDYSLPLELIAQQPLAVRDASRMMVLRRDSQTFEDQHFTELPEILSAGDLLVFNNTRVFPARLLGRRAGMRAQPISRNNPAASENLTGEAELFLARNEGNGIWQGLVHPGRKIGIGEVLIFGDGELEAEIIGRGEFGLRRAQLKTREGTVEAAIDRLGHVPLPPYIHRPDNATDRPAYQTIFARERGAVAAPTAGLHFTERVLVGLKARGVEMAEITLHVGLGTFQPVRVRQIEDHRMEKECFEILEDAAAAVNRALDEGRRIIAVGTTCVRTLEHSAAQNGGRLRAGTGETGLFITPGFEYRLVRGLLTNFHLPKSTLLMLVCAFAGRDFVLRAYHHAFEQRYRFYSYGDCMLIL